MRKYAFIMLVGCLSTFSVFGANIEWKVGYVVSLNNDTIRGEVARLEQDKDYLECLYRKERNEQVTVYTPKEINAYGFDEGLVYVSTSLKGERYFMQHLLSGIVELYYFQEGEKATPEYLIERKDMDRFLILKDISYKGDRYKEIRRNRAKLAVFLGDCPEIQESVKKLRGTRKEYIDLFQEYHDYRCNDEVCVIYVEEKPERTHYLTPFIGPRYVMTYYNTDLYRNTSFVPVMGVDYSTSLERYSEKWMLHVGLDVSYLSLSSNKESYPINYDYKFNALWLHNNIGISYNFVSTSWKPFLIVGLFHEALLPTANKFSRNLKFDYDKYTQGVLFGAGVHIPLKNGTQMPVRFLWEEVLFGKALKERNILLNSFLNLTIGYTFRL